MSNLMQEAVQAWKSGDVHTAELKVREELKQQPWNGDALNMLGSIAGRVGKHEASADLLRKAVAAAPKVVPFRENLARALLQLNKADEAEIVLRDIDMESQPASVLALWAAVLGKNGKLEQGITFAQKAVDSEPEQPTHLYNLAELQRRNGDRPQALKNLEKALKIAPDQSDVLNNLAGMQLAEGEFVDALRSLEKLLQIAPKSSQAYFNLGKLLSASGDPEAATTALRNARKLAPASERILFQLANSLAQIGHFDEASEAVEELRAGHADSVMGKVLHARILERKGDVDAAAEIVATISDDHRLNPAVANVVALLQEQNQEYQAAVDTLSAVLDANEAEQADWVSIHFSLGDLFDKLGQHDKAFTHYAIGNENRKKAFFNKEEVVSKSKVSERLTQLYAKQPYEQKPDSGLDTSAPIFIIGMPRSGTSLTEQILSCHSQVYGAGELQAFHNAVAATYPKPEDTSNAPFKIVATDPSAGQSLVPLGWDGITQEQLADLGHSYLDAVRKRNPEISFENKSQRVTDKMPFNFFSAPLIHKVFPNAKILHCTRDPLDTCLSCYFQNFMSGNQYAFDLTQLGEFYKEYQAIMEHWDTLDIPMFNVRYETLVTAPEQMTREMLDYCGLPWEPECLQSHKSKRPVITASYQQVREPIYTKSVGRWKHYEGHLSPLLEALNLPSQA